MPFMDWMGPGERHRHAAFLRPERQRQFLVGRALLRRALSDLLHRPASSFVIEEQSGLPPLVSDTAARISLSHSGPWVACAVSKDIALGVDIEQLDDTRDVMALAQQAFDEHEYALLAAAPVDRRARCFYDCWSRKEALFKLGAAERASLHAPCCIGIHHASLSIVLCADAALDDLDIRRVNVSRGRFVSCTGQ